MAEQAQASNRRSEREPTAAELFDPLALEARLIEARARRAEALARKGKPDPVKRGAATIAPIRPEIAPPPEPVAVVEEPVAGSPSRSRLLPLLLTGTFIAGLVGAGAALVLAPPAVRQRIAEVIAPPAAEAPLAVPAGEAPDASAPEAAIPDPVTVPVQNVEAAPIDAAPAIETAAAPLSAGPAGVPRADLPAPSDPTARIPAERAAVAPRPAAPESFVRLAGVPRPAPSVREPAAGAPGLAQVPDIPAESTAQAALIAAAFGESVREVSGVGPNIGQLRSSPEPLVIEAPVPVLPERVVIHYPAGAGDAARTAAAALNAAGAADTSTVEVGSRVGSTDVRYFHAADAAGAGSVLGVLAAGLRPGSLEARNFTDFRPQPEPGMVEVWLAGPPPAARVVEPAATPRAATPPRQTAPVVSRPVRSGTNRSDIERSVERLLREQLDRR